MIGLLAVLAQAADEDSTAYQLGYLLAPLAIVVVVLVIVKLSRRGTPSPPGAWGEAPRAGHPAAGPAPGPAQGGPQPASWYPDPWGQARLRWWDGSRWTEHTQA